MLTLLSLVLFRYVRIPGKVFELSCSITLLAESPLLRHGTCNRQGDTLHLLFEETLPKITVSSTTDVFLEESFDRLMKGLTALCNVYGVLFRILLGRFVRDTRLRRAALTRYGRYQVVAIVLLSDCTTCPGTLAWGVLTAKRAPLPLRTAEILVGELVSQTGGNIIGVVSALTLLIGRLGCGKVLLLVLALVLVLRLLPIRLGVLGIHEIVSASSICCRILKLTSNIVIVALTTLVREDWLRES